MQPIDDVLAAHDELIQQIKLCYGERRETFEADLLPLIRRYAEYVYLLPATADNYFRAPGGLLRLGLEVAFYALQATDGHIFSGQSTISQRRLLEPRWRLATFIAGLCAELHRPLGHLTVFDPTGQAWPAYLQPLHVWLQQREATRFVVHWALQAPDLRSMGAFVLPHIVAASTLQYLADGNTLVVPHLLAAVGGIPMHREHNVLAGVVLRASALVIDRDLRARAAHDGRPRAGAHLGRYVIDVIQRLAATNPAWTPNGEKSRVWYGQDGVYILWPQGARDILKTFEAGALPGMPASVDALLAALVASGAVDAIGTSSPICAIATPDSDRTMDAIRLASPQLVLAALPETTLPLSRRLAALATSTVPVVDPPAAVPKQGRTMDLPLAAAPISAGEAPKRDRLEMDMPLRLDPTLRATLGDLIAAINHDGETPGYAWRDAGLWVAYGELERRGIEPARAMRLLADASMLSTARLSPRPSDAGSAGAFAHPGVVIDARFFRRVASPSVPPV